MSEFLLWALVAVALILVGFLLRRARRREKALDDETSRLRVRIQDLEQQVADARAGWTLAEERLEELANELAELRGEPRERHSA
jgi:chromosome segregation ATPase